MAEMARVPKGVDASRASSARVFDYLLGGKDNYEVDQAVARCILQVAPDTRALTWFCRRFLCSAVALAADAGVRQFVDIGAGLPTSPNTHEIAWQRDTSARVVYVDNDAVVYAHGNVMVRPLPGARMMLEDIRRPGDLLSRLAGEAGIDFDEPVALIMCGLLHYILDDEHPGQILATLRDTAAAGSYLALTHQTDRSEPVLMDRIQEHTNGTPAQCVFRPIEQIAALAAGWEVLEPGLVTVQDWLGGGLPRTRLDMVGGVYRKVDDCA